MGETRPFKIDIPQAELDRVKRRINEYEWFEEPVDAGWDYGCNQAVLRELCDYWVTDYDWRREETALNAMPQFLAEVNGIDIHFFHEKGSNPENRPIIMLHGWPGSFLELTPVIDPLAHPEKYGGDASDGRDVIVPSLIGYGFSGKPDKPMGPRAMGGYFDKLMTEVLGYDSYVAQGGDWGGLVCNWMGFDFGEDKGGKLHAIHVNLIGVRPAGEGMSPTGAAGILAAETEEEKRWEQEAMGRFAFESAYFQVQATKPQSLSYAMMDSPVGVAAWLTEKFHTWSDLSGKGEPGGSLWNTYTKDQLLSSIMLYVVTRRFNTAAWNYYGGRVENAFVFPAGARVEIPVGVGSYPREIAPVPPRSYCEKAYNIVRYTEQPKGGHFAAFEQPELFLEDLTAFLKDWG